MGYLICEKCGGYYELQKGESSDDFQNCECGGKFKYVESIDGLNQKSDIKNHSNNSSSKKRFNLADGLNKTAILIGLAFGLVFSLFLHYESSLYAWAAITVLSGSLAGYIAGGKISNGMKNGFLGSLSVPVVFAIGLLIFSLSTGHNPGIIQLILEFVLVLLIISIIFGLIGLIGGLIGSAIRNRQDFSLDKKDAINSKNNIKTGSTLFCVNCGTSNLISSKFCKKCGEKLDKNHLKTKNSAQESLKTGIKQAEAWWNNQTKQTKGGLVIVGIILFVGIISVVISNNSFSSDYADPYSLSFTTLSESDYKASCQFVAMADLNKNPTNYIGEDIHWHGKITDIHEELGKTNIIMQGWEDDGAMGKVTYITYVFYDGSTPYHIGDAITVYGQFYGEYTYYSKAGTDETVPAITARYISS